MSRKKALSHQASRFSHQQEQVPYALSPIAAIVAGVALMGTSAAWAADDTVVVAQAAQAGEGVDQADAPQTLEAVVVRSRNRLEKLQDVPLSVSVVTGSELARLGATDINDITKRAGNVSWNLGNQRTSSLSVRGIGKVGQTEAQDPSVGVIVDGVNYAYNALTSSFDFVDIDTVEVTRGPQGTLLGKNTSLGVISFNTRKPSFSPTADYSLAFSQRDGFAGTLAAGGPVVDDLLAWRGSFSVSRQRGDLVNAYNRDVTYTNTDRVAGRVQFLLTPNPDFSARVIADLQPRAGEATNGRTINTPRPTTWPDGSAITTIDNEQRLARRWFTQNTGFSLADYFNGGADGHSVNNDSARPLVTGSRGLSAELNWKLADGYTLTSITGLKTYHFNAVNDEGTPFDIYRNSGGFWNDYRQTTQELRISSPVGGFVDYQAGLYYIQVHNSAEYQRVWGNDAGAWLANAGQYTRLDADAAGRQLLTNSLANLSMAFNNPTGLQDIRNKSSAGFAQANWHLSEPLTLTTGLRLTHEDRRNTGTSAIKSNGSAPELNPANVNGVNLGGFSSTLAGSVFNGLIANATNANVGFLNTNDPTQLAVANAAAKKYFGVNTYAELTGAQAAQIAAAKSIRAAAIGVVFPNREAEKFSAWQPAFVVSPSYKFSANQTGYVSWQYGQKAGIAQFVNGVSSPVKAEKSNSLEIGLKSALLDKTLTLNADIFFTAIKDYQQSVRIVDEYTTALNNDGRFAYTTATGNAPKVQASGLEVDGVYSGIRNTTLRFSGAYNRAIYKEFTNAAQPNEAGTSIAGKTIDPYRDISGSQLAGAPKLSFNLGADYRYPVFDDKEVFTSANLAYTGRFNSDTSLSSYSWIKASTTVDASLGLGKRNKTFSVNFLVKNLFNDDTPRSQSWTGYTPAVPRTFGIVFTGKI